MAMSRQGESGLTHLMTLTQATLKLGKLHKQDAIYDLKNREVISVHEKFREAGALHHSFRSVRQGNGSASPQDSRQASLFKS
jgi:hypothetical protein